MLSEGLQHSIALDGEGMPLKINPGKPHNYLKSILKWQIKPLDLDIIHM